ncbi:hypothetical protein D3C80_1464640 [compost metagenome]
MGEHKAALGVVVLHGEYAVHANARPRAQAGQQTVAAGVPQRIAEAMAAKFRAHDEETHEAEFAAVAGDGAAADQFAVQLGSDEGLGVGGPEQFGIVPAGIPALLRRPADQQVQLGAGHLAYHKLIGHRAVLPGSQSYANSQDRCST